jgi:uncharacterized protein YPO0396
MNGYIVNFAGSKPRLINNLNPLKPALRELNASLQQIEFHAAPPTYIQIRPKRCYATMENRNFDVRQSLGRRCVLEYHRLHETPELEISFKKVKTIIERMANDEAWRKNVTDVRNWLEFGALEKHRFDASPKRYYDDSQGLSGGEKAKLAYTIPGVSHRISIWQLTRKDINQNPSVLWWWMRPSVKLTRKTPCLRWNYSNNSTCSSWW